MKDLQEQPLEHIQSVLEERQIHLLRQVRMRVAAGEGVNAGVAGERKGELIVAELGVEAVPLADRCGDE